MRLALRDASIYRTHRLTTGATLQHIPVYHAIKPDEPYLSRCGRLIDPASETEDVGITSRCTRPGCRQAWDAASSEERVEGVRRYGREAAMSPPGGLRKSPAHMKTLADFSPRQQDFLLRAFWEGVPPDDPIASPARTKRLEAAGLIHKRTSKKGRTSWRVTDVGRGIVAAHVPCFLHKRGFPSYTHKPWQAMHGEPESVTRPEAA